MAKDEASSSSSRPIRRTTDSANKKVEYIYRLLVHDKVIQAIPEIQVSQQTMSQKLAIWASKLNA